MSENFERDLYEHGLPRKKIVVPEGMLKAAISEGVWRDPHSSDGMQCALEAALRWLSENPITPTNDQANELWAIGLQQSLTKNETDHAAKNIARAWQRRMFYGPEPEYPEDVLELLRTYPKAAADVIVAAYRLGQKSK